MITLEEAIEQRHSVRQYKNIPIDADVREKLDEFTETCNAESGLHVRIVYDDPDGFDSRLAHYGRFRNVSNYIVLAGKKTENFDQLCGYYGEKIVLYAQQLGLNTCWAAMSFNKKNVRRLVPEGETLCMVISLGYGETQGHPHKGKKLSQVTKGDCPDWFAKGVEAALLAPTAVNQQKFMFELVNGEPHASVKGIGSCTKVDLGIAAYHFESATGVKAIM